MKLHLLEYNFYLVHFSLLTRWFYISCLCVNVAIIKKRSFRVFIDIIWKSICSASYLPKKAEFFIQLNLNNPNPTGIYYTLFRIWLYYYNYVFSRSSFSQKNSIIEICQGPKYASLDDTRKRNLLFQQK